MSTNNDARRLERIILSHYCGEHERTDPVRISWMNEIKNVLIDVMHLAAERGVDFDQALAAAGYVYRSESRGENTSGD